MKEILGKPTKVASNKHLKDDIYEYVDIMNDNLKGDYWVYEPTYGKKIGSWNPILEKYEDLMIYFYNGRVYSLIRNETY